tara:strand:- start:356 stop:802 length:447 start_codon:yes stop_codon:yes gene_type:complete
MAGAALMPEYYTEKFNLCIFYAPPASMHNNPQVLVQTVSKPTILNGIVDAISLVGQYNLLPYNYLNTGAASLVCGLFNGAICNLIMSGFADEDPSIDYTDRYDVYMSNTPSGAGYKDFTHYGQNVAAATESFKRYDMGSAKANQDKYG